MNTDRKILVSFDVEEFDLPLEYNLPISTEEQLQTGYNGLMEILPLLHTPHIHTTLFTTAFFAEQYPEVIQSLSAKHEIASHTYHHSSFKTEDLKTSKEALEKITGKTVTGLRMPRMKQVPASDVREAGYLYNSSINPTWVPGRYNNLKLPRRPSGDGGIIQFPVSVTPHLRIPLFWLLFKNIPYLLYRQLVLQTLKKDGCVCLYFHPWEFTSLDAYPLPQYIKRGSKEKLLLQLNTLLKDLSNEGTFCTMSDYIKGI